MTRSFLAILGTNLRRGFWRSFSAGIGVVVGIGSLYFFVTVGTGLSGFIQGREMQKLPMNMLRVRATELELGVFRFGTPSFLRSATISPDAVAAFRALPGVAEAHPVMNIHFPISSYISFEGILPDARFRRGYRTDLIMSGAPESLVKEDVAMPGVAFTGKTWPIPVLVSRRILDIYNAGFAAAADLPRLTEKALLGFRLELVLGQSTLVRRLDVEGVRVPCQVVGFTEKAETLGLVMPIDYAQLYNSRFVAGWKSAVYSSVYVLAASSDRVAGIADGIEKLGYTVHAEKKLSNLILLVTLLLGLFSSIIVAVAAIGIFNAFSVIVLQRRMEIGLFRSFGATRRFIKGVFLAEGAAVGLVNGVLGLAGGILLVRVTWSLVRDALPPFFQTADLFPVSLPLALALVAGSVLTSLAATYVPAALASRLQIGEALRR